MRRGLVVGLVAVLVLGGTACGGSVDSAELEALREEVATLQAQVVAAAQELEALREEVATLQAQVVAVAQGSEWPDEYQTLWVDICQLILADAAAGDGLSSRDICRCTLDGLMKAFSLKDYESWPQDVKDGAAAPYATWCWTAG